MVSQGPCGANTKLDVGKGVPTDKLSLKDFTSTSSKHKL
jgi:hypothetical protein